MADVQTTSLSIQFKAILGSSKTANGASLYLNAELDDVKNVKSSPFLFGDSVFFKIYTNATTVDLSVSSGNIDTHGVATEDIVDETIVFSLPVLPAIFAKTVEDNSVSLKYHASNTPSFSKIAGANLAPSLSPIDDNLVLGNGFGVAIFNTTYQTTYKSYSLENVAMPSGFPPDTSFPVIVFIAAY